jgi:hypothetical protein
MQRHRRLNASCAHAAASLPLLQNQIKSEEQFQAKKTELHKAAVERLESVFEKKGKVGGLGNQRMLRHASTPEAACATQRQGCRRHCTPATHAHDFALWGMNLVLVVVLHAAPDHRL